MALILKIDFEAPFHHGTGEGVAGILDRALLRDGDGVPYLSGAAVKGKFRWAALRWLRSTEEGNKDCRPEEGRFCREDFCTFCSLFGSPRTPGAAEFSDAYPVNRDWFAWRASRSPSVLLSGPAAIRATTAINRLTRTVEREHLFTTEILSETAEFAGRIDGKLDAKMEELISNAAALLSYFGSGSSRGTGFCRYKVEKVAERKS